MYQSSHHQHASSSAMSGIQGQLLEVTVVGCTKLKDTEWISRQDPYVIVQYGSNKSRTRTCTDGGKNPVFQEKFVFTLIEGLQELEVFVWNSNTLTFDDFIGSGKIQMHKALSEGFDDTTWPLQTKTGRYAGEVRLILHYANARKQPTTFAPSAPPYATHPPHSSMYPAQPPVPTAPYGPPAPAYTTPSPSPYSTYPPSSAYPPPSSGYPPPNSGYPPSAYPQPPAAYPPSTYPPPSAYPPSPYPPPPSASPYHPPGPFPGIYPPPPY